ncbi:Lsr2 family DNA-binding protein [Streptomyces lasiicapitis]|uniref:Lsr2 family DNA-binding protein n=1 Tax=Streptomyces lasiicapitis TaxID=1923961 RepID=UPI003667D44B
MAEDQDRHENQPGMRNAPTRGKEQESGSALRSWAKEQGANLNDRGGRQKGRRGTRGASTKGKEDSNSGLRSWAKEQGYNLNDRGRVPADIKEAYERARDNG